ncbi:MAG: ACP S-malonyltransferase [Acidimicrobiia bacterium]|nr:ACP S-malonyltransferase [Acidimicrobiia bacterium]
MSYAVLFPGQGSQFVGMGADLFDARPDLLIDQADETLGWSLRDMCLDGPEEELTRTERAQPALFAIAFALWDELARRLRTRPAAAAGHSLGEYTALAAAGAFDFATALRIVALRGTAMASAADAEPSSMAALIGATAELAGEVASSRRQAGGRLWVANLNAPGQVVVAGGAADIEWLQNEGRTLGLRRVVPLKVAGAFHSPFMASAQAELAAGLATVVPERPEFPVWSNVDAAPVAVAEIPELLARQVVAPVRFSDTLDGIAEQGIRTFVHVGPGDVTAGMARRTVPGADVLVVNDLISIEEAIGKLEGDEEEGP